MPTFRLKRTRKLVRVLRRRIKAPKENGPSSVFDGQSDLELIKYLRESNELRHGGSKINGQPVNLLNGAEVKGYRVIGTAVRGDTIIWTLHKEKDERK